MIGESIICEDMNFFAFIQTFYIAGLLISCVSRKLFRHLNVINLGIFSKWRKIEVVKWAEDAIYAPIQTTDDKNRSLR